MEHLTAAYDKADDTSAPSTTKKTEDFDSMKDRMALAPITPQVQDLLVSSFSYHCGVFELW